MKPTRESTDDVRLSAASVRLTAGARRRAIARIMEARFLLVAFEEIRDSAHWTWPANPPESLMGRGIRSQAVLEKKRLVGASDALLCAELANLPGTPVTRHPS